MVEERWSKMSGKLGQKFRRYQGDDESEMKRNINDLSQFSVVSNLQKILLRNEVEIHHCNYNRRTRNNHYNSCNCNNCTCYTYDIQAF